MRLQSSIAAHVASPGGMPFNKYRAFRSTVRQADEPYRFVDGELIERFLDCSPGLQKEIVAMVGRSSVTVEYLKGIVEGLRRMH